MVVAWGTQDGGEEAGTPWIVRAAVRAQRAAAPFQHRHAARAQPGHRAAGRRGRRG